MKRLFLLVVMGGALITSATCIPKNKPKKSTSPVEQVNAWPSGDTAQKPASPSITVVELMPSDTGTKSVSESSPIAAPKVKPSKPTPPHKVTVPEKTTPSYKPSPAPSQHTTTTPAPPPHSPAVTQPTTESQTFVYRVQLFAFQSFHRANDALLRLKKKYPSYKFTIETEDNMYKVQAGDFATRSDAEKARDFLRNNGYKDAFIVGVMTP